MGSIPGSFFWISSPKKVKKSLSFACLSSQHCGLHLRQTLPVFGATYPVRRTPSSEPLVGQFARFLWSSSTAAWTDSQRSFLGPTSQLRLIVLLEVFLFLAFRLDHVCSAQRPASVLSLLALSARYQVSSSFNLTPGYPNFLACC